MRVYFNGASPQLLCHCERSEAIHFTACTALNHGLPRRYAPRNDLYLYSALDPIN